jgi:hypothetical protein
MEITYLFYFTGLFLYDVAEKSLKLKLNPALASYYKKLTIPTITEKQKAETENCRS